MATRMSLETGFIKINDNNYAPYVLEGFPTPCYSFWNSGFNFAF